MNADIYPGLAATKNDAPILESGMFEIEKETDRETGESEVVEHLSEFVIGNFRNGLCVHDDLVESNEIRNVLTNLCPLVEQWKPLLLATRNLTPLELDDQGILIRFLVKSMANLIMNRKRTPQNRFRFLLTWKI